METAVTLEAEAPAPKLDLEHLTPEEVDHFYGEELLNTLEVSWNPNTSKARKVLLAKLGVPEEHLDDVLAVYKATEHPSRRARRYAMWAAALALLNHGVEPPKAPKPTVEEVEEEEDDDDGEE